MNKNVSAGKSYEENCIGVKGRGVWSGRYKQHFTPSAALT